MCIKVKVCGITNKGDAINSIQAGADYLGFILYSQSPRFINLENVNRILESLKDTSGKTVAVDVVPSIADVVLMQQADFQFYQFHFHGQRDQ